MVKSKSNDTFVLPNLFLLHSNIILPSTPRSSMWSLPFRFSD